MLGRGQQVFWLLAAALAATVVGTLGRLPARVASHFDGSGAPNGWSSRPVYGLLILAIGILMPLAIVGIVTLVTRRGPGLLNIPAREYWTRPEHGAEAVRRVRVYLWWLGGVLAGIALAMHLLVLDANRADPPRLGTGAMLLVMGAVLAAIGAWTVGFYRLMRPPGRR